MSNLINLKGKEEFKTSVLESKTPVLVDFWAPWCGPCQMMAPVLEDIAKKFGDKLVVAKVDTEETENQTLAMEYQIRSIPNLKLFINGKVVADYVGFRPANVFEEELKENIN